MLENITRAIFESRYPFCYEKAKNNSLKPDVEQARKDAEAAIAACLAVEMLEALREAVAANRLRPPPYRTRMQKAETFVMKLDWDL